MISPVEYPWLDLHWRHLLGYVRQDRVPQALLAIGPPGVGKTVLMTGYAKALLCSALRADGNACGYCASCKLFDAQTHPDFLFVEPDQEGKSIGIDSVRQLVQKLVLKPQFDRFRVAVLRPAESMTVAAANAFLKCLEEPTERTCIVLISAQPTKLPATIRSRCQVMTVNAPLSIEAMRWLTGQQITDDAQVLLNLAQGAPLLAKQYAEDRALPARRAHFDEWLGIVEGRGNWLTLAEQWHKQAQPGLAVLLQWQCGWIVDLIKFKLGADSGCCANADLEMPLQALAGRLELKKLFKHYDLLLQSRKQIDTQVNKQLLVERILIEWSHLNGK